MKINNTVESVTLTGCSVKHSVFPGYGVPNRRPDSDSGRLPASTGTGLGSTNGYPGNTLVMQVRPTVKRFVFAVTRPSLFLYSDPNHFMTKFYTKFAV